MTKKTTAKIHSMTGFAEHSAMLGKTSYFCRIRSVNHRFLDLKVRLPRHDSHALESEIKALLQKSFARGAVELSIGYASRDTKAETKQRNPNVDLRLVELYAKSAKQAAKKIGASAKIDLATILRLPGVITEESDVSVEEALVPTEVLSKLVLPAVEKLLEARAREGKTTVTHMQSLMKDIRQEFSSINECSEEERAKLAQALQTRIEETRTLLGGPKSPDFELRLRQEAAFWLDRRDIEEEQVRFRSHLDEFEKVFVDAKEPSGKKLDFLHQEISREINTLGNKAQSTKISKHVVEIKTLLEKFKEQVANVE